MASTNQPKCTQNKTRLSTNPHKQNNTREKISLIKEGLMKIKTAREIHKRQEREQRREYLEGFLNYQREEEPIGTLLLNDHSNH
jgi:hypothetical protein